MFQVRTRSDLDPAPLTEGKQPSESFFISFFYNWLIDINLFQPEILLLLLILLVLTEYVVVDHFWFFLFM